MGPYLEASRTLVLGLAGREHTPAERRSMEEWVWLQLEHRSATDVLPANPQLGHLLVERFPGTGAVDYVVKVTYDHLPRAELVHQLVDAAEDVLAPRD